MKRLLSKHVQRYAMFALLLLAFLLGSVSTYGFAGMDGQAVMVQAQGEDDVLTEVDQNDPVVDTDEPETREAGKIQKVNADTVVEGENREILPPPLPENQLEPGLGSDSDHSDQITPEPEKPNDPEQPAVEKPLKNPDSEPGDLKEADKEKTKAPAEENEIQAQPGQVDPNKFPEPPTNEGDTFGSSEDLVPEAVRGGNPVFTVTKRPVVDPDASEEPVGDYNTFHDAMENCKQEDTSNLYIITVNRDYTITATEGSWGKSKVNILLRSADGGPVSIRTKSKWVFFTLYQDCNVRIENLTLDGSHRSEFVFLADNGALTLGAGVTVQNFIDVVDQDGPAIYMKGQSSLTVEPGVVIKNNQSNTTGGVICGNDDNTIINIMGGSFINNSSTKQGSAGGFGGVIASFGTLNITGGSFEGNSATNKGGAIWLSRNAKSQISNASFLNNQADIGGAISASCRLNISQCKLDQNKANWGGAVYLDLGGDIEQSIFNNNEAGKSGGAIYSADAVATIKNCNFSANSASTKGGALYFNGVDKGKIKPDSKVDISTNTCFKGNSVTSESSEGGAIFYTPYIYQNSITPEDGAYFGLTIDNTTLFQNNKAGGGLFNPPSTYAQFTNLGFSSDSDVTHGVLTRESVLNNYDVNFKNSACLITYIANGGEFADGSEQQVEEHEIDENITIKAAPGRAGYRFIAWQSNQAEYQPGNTYTVKGNATFVAQWEIINPPAPQPEPDDHGVIEGLSLRPVPPPNQNIVALVPVSTASTPKKIYNLPATGSASPALDIFMGLGLIFVGLLLKKRS